MKENNRWITGLHRTAACTLFIISFLVLLTYAERLLMEKNAERAMVAHEAVAPQSVDVVFLGSSHVYGGVIPQKLMDDYGIASINASSALQPLWQSVYEMEWLLQRQKPRVVVLDLFLPDKLPRGIGDAPDSEHRDYQYSFLGVLHRAMPWINPIKYTAAMRETMLDPNAIPYLSTISVRHPDLWAVDWKDFQRVAGHSISHAALNYFYLFEHFADFPEAFPEPDAAALLPEFSAKQLRLLAELCQRNQIELIFTAIPHWPSASWLNHMEQVRLLAEEVGVTYLPMETIIENSEFDFGSDMADFGHTNFTGAKKVSEYLGRYLKEQYELPDRREDADPRYDAWKKRPYQYEAYDTASYMQYVREIDEWSLLTENLNEDFLTIFAYNQPYDKRNPEWVNYDIISNLGAMGLEHIGEFLEEQGNYFAILDGAEIREEGMVQGELNFASLENGFPLTIRTENGGNLQVKLGNRDISCGHEGLNIIFYNKVENRLIKGTCLDLCGEEVFFGH